MRASTNLRLRALAATLTLGVAGSVYAGNRVVVDRIAAVIEDDIITLRELEEKAKSYFSQLEGIEDPTERETRRDKILRDVLDLEIRERMIDKEIATNSEKLAVTDQDVDRAVDEVMKMNNLSQDQLQAALYGQGMSWSEYRKKLRKQIERARLVQFQVQGKVEVKEADVRRRCLERKRGGRIDSNQRVCASHILLKIPAGASEEQIANLESRASELRSQLVGGADFGELALKNSDDPGAPGGDLGCFGRGEMVQAFEAAAFTQDIGDISEPVRTQFGLHLIRVNSRELQEEGCTGQDELAPIQGEIYQEELERQMNAWVEELRDKSFVEVRL